jgi:hypothetical protein
VTSGLTENEGERHTLGLLERLRAGFKDLWGTSSMLHFRLEALLRELADPNLRDIPTDLPFRVEMWDRHDNHILGHLGFIQRSDRPCSARRGDRQLSSERFTLGNGALVIREYKPAASRSPRLFIFVNQITHCAQLKHNAFEPSDVRGNGCEVGKETCIPTISLARPDSHPPNVQIAGVRSTGQCNTACSLLAGVSKPKVFRGR